MSTPAKAGPAQAPAGAPAPGALPPGAAASGALPTGAPASGALPTGAPARGGETWLPRWMSFGLLPFLLALTVSVTAVALRNRAELARTLGQPAAGVAGPVGGTVAGPATTASLSPRRQLLGLSDLPDRAAPDFTLTDQTGRRVSLSSFRGTAVLLAFLDSRCTEVCPVLAQELLAAEHDLGATAAKVTFVGVNVNPMATSVADVARFDAQHGLTGLGNWHFLTGAVPALARVWADYGIQVIVPQGATQTVHAAYLYFITPAGRERYLASPQVRQRPDGTGYLPAPTIAEWGSGIATYLRRLAP